MDESDLANILCVQSVQAVAYKVLVPASTPSAATTPATAAAATTALAHRQSLYTRTRPSLIRSTPLLREYDRALDAGYPAVWRLVPHAEHQHPPHLDRHGSDTCLRAALLQPATTTIDLASAQLWVFSWSTGLRPLAAFHPASTSLAESRSGEFSSACIVESASSPTGSIELQADGAEPREAYALFQQAVQNLFERKLAARGFTRLGCFFVAAHQSEPTLLSRQANSIDALRLFVFFAFDKLVFQPSLTALGLDRLSLDWIEAHAAMAEPVPIFIAPHGLSGSLVPSLCMHRDRLSQLSKAPILVTVSIARQDTSYETQTTADTDSSAIVTVQVPISAVFVPAAIPHQRPIQDVIETQAKSSKTRARRATSRKSAAAVAHLAKQSAQHIKLLDTVLSQIGEHDSIYNDLDAADEDAASPPAVQGEAGPFAPGGTAALSSAAGAGSSAAGYGSVSMAPSASQSSSTVSGVGASVSFTSNGNLPGTPSASQSAPTPDRSKDTKDAKDTKGKPKDAKDIGKKDALSAPKPAAAMMASSPSVKPDLDMEMDLSLNNLGDLGNLGSLGDLNLDEVADDDFDFFETKSKPAPKPIPKAASMQAAAPSVLPSQAAPGGVASASMLGLSGFSTSAGGLNAALGGSASYATYNDPHTVAPSPAAAPTPGSSHNHPFSPPFFNVVQTPHADPTSPAFAASPGRSAMDAMSPPAASPAPMPFGSPSYGMIDLVHSAHQSPAPGTYVPPSPAKLSGMSMASPALAHSSLGGDKSGRASSSSSLHSNDGALEGNVGQDASGAMDIDDELETDQQPQQHNHQDMRQRRQSTDQPEAQQPFIVHAQVVEVFVSDEHVLAERSTEKEKIVPTAWLPFSLVSSSDQSALASVSSADGSMVRDKHGERYGGLHSRWQYSPSEHGRVGKHASAFVTPSVHLEHADQPRQQPPVTDSLARSATVGRIEQVSQLDPEAMACLPVPADVSLMAFTPDGGLARVPRIFEVLSNEAAITAASGATETDAIVLETAAADPRPKSRAGAGHSKWTWRVRHSQGRRAPLLVFSQPTRQCMPKLIDAVRTILAEDGIVDPMASSGSLATDGSVSSLGSASAGEVPAKQSVRGPLNLTELHDLQNSDKAFAKFGTLQLRKKKRAADPVIETLPAPTVLFRHDGALMAASALSLRFWTKLHMEPVSGRKRLGWVALVGSTGDGSDGSDGVSGQWAVCRLGDARVYGETGQSVVSVALAAGRSLGRASGSPRSVDGVVGEAVAAAIRGGTLDRVSQFVKDAATGGRGRSDTDFSHIGLFVFVPFGADGDVGGMHDPLHARSQGESDKWTRVQRKALRAVAAHTGLPLYLVSALVVVYVVPLCDGYGLLSPPVVRQTVCLELYSRCMHLVVQADRPPMIVPAPAVIIDDGRDGRAAYLQWGEVPASVGAGGRNGVTNERVLVEPDRVVHVVYEAEGQEPYVRVRVAWSDHRGEMSDTGIVNPRDIAQGRGGTTRVTRRDVFVEMLDMVARSFGTGGFMLRVVVHCLGEIGRTETDDWVGAIGDVAGRTAGAAMDAMDTTPDAAGRPQTQPCAIRSVSVCCISTAGALQCFRHWSTGSFNSSLPAATGQGMSPPSVLHSPASHPLPLVGMPSPARSGGPADDSTWAEETVTVAYGLVHHRVPLVSSGAYLPLATGWIIRGDQSLRVSLVVHESAVGGEAAVVPGSAAGPAGWSGLPTAYAAWDATAATPAAGNSASVVVTVASVLGSNAANANVANAAAPAAAVEPRHAAVVKDVVRQLHGLDAVGRLR
ncbi:hypothetical protein BC831DRAFT_468193, partial [Entophlyctis helioformis]